jgi:TldD protein
MKQICEWALQAALDEGADYADTRLVATDTQGLHVRNGAPSALWDDQDQGLGVRVLAGGAWGFAGTSVLGRDSVLACARRAVAIARASAAVNPERVRLAPEPARRDFWQTPVLRDPLAVSLQERLELLLACDRELRRDARVKVAFGSVAFLREHIRFLSSEGQDLEQVLVRGGAGISATASDGRDSQTRSYPMSHGGQWMSMGWELVESLDLVGNAHRVAEEAIALLSAPECPSGRMDLILKPAQLVLQIHESVGHATELDRVLGYEANYAGTSFATVDKLGHFRYGSPLVNLVADGTVPGGLATRGYDDDGVRQQRWPIVEQGILKGYATNRELAHAVEEAGSRGCNRAETWGDIPIVRINNLSLMPGETNWDDLVAGVDDGVIMDCNRSWSIDQRRLNFQFGCEIGWRVLKGRITGLVRNPTYQGMTPEFWGSCDAICGPDLWQLVGISNCGKGQPGQTAHMSHGSSPARFRGVQLGIQGS